MKKDINDIVIGDKLYSYVALGFHEYKVIGIRTREGEKNQLVVQDQACSHGWKCELVIHQDPVGNLARNIMLNDDEGSQGYCHTQGPGDHYLHTTLAAAKKEVYSRSVAQVKRRVEELEKRLAQEKKSLAKYEEIVAIAIADLEGES